MMRSIHSLRKSLFLFCAASKQATQTESCLYGDHKRHQQQQQQSRMQAINCYNYAIQATSATATKTTKTTKKKKDKNTGSGYEAYARSNTKDVAVTMTPCLLARRADYTLYDTTLLMASTQHHHPQTQKKRTSPRHAKTDASDALRRADQTHQRASPNQP